MYVHAQYAPSIEKKRNISISFHTGMSSVDVFKYTRYLLGDSLLPSHPSNWEFYEDTGFDLPFWKRLTNYVEMLAYIYRWTYTYIPHQQEITHKYLGSNAGDLYNIMKNMSLLLIGQSSKLIYTRPEVPNIIYFDSLHITEKPPLLSKVYIRVYHRYRKVDIPY